MKQCVGEESPFLECEQSYFKLVSSPVAGGPLEPVFWYFRGVEALTSKLRAYALCMGAQVWWRFGVFRNFPVKLVKMLTASDPASVAQEFFDTPACCKSEAFCEKITKLFGSAAQLAGDLEFKELLGSWSLVARLCNMHVERMLALIKQSVAPSGNSRGVFKA